jgi:hypothetical protein
MFYNDGYQNFSKETWTPISSAPTVFYISISTLTAISMW